MNTPFRVAAALLAPSLLLAGCGGIEPTPVPEPEVESQERGEPAKDQLCTPNARQSYAPEGSVDQLRASALGQLEEGGRLIAGVSADNHLLGARDPLTGELEGFDIEMIRIIARTLFPGVQDIDSKITYRVITAADRIDFVAKGAGDVVARNMTANCDRWKEVAFSAIYYDSGQRLLVRRGLTNGARPVKSVDDLSRGHTVCVPAATTSQANIEREVSKTKAVVVTSARTTGCLVKFQRGEADAITSDDTVLAGLAAQDPYAFVPPRQDAFSAEPYGVAMNLKDTALVRFVNAALEQAVRDGSWQRAYDKWLAPHLGAGEAPRPEYGR